MNKQFDIELKNCADLSVKFSHRLLQDLRKSFILCAIIKSCRCLQQCLVTWRRPCHLAKANSEQAELWVKRQEIGLLLIVKTI